VAEDTVGGDLWRNTKGLHSSPSSKGGEKMEQYEVRYKQLIDLEPVP
jgi:hypothetical protein